LSSGFGVDITVSEAFFGLALIAILTALAVIDACKMILPDQLNLLLAVIGVGQSLALHEPGMLDAAFGALIGTALLTLVLLLFRRFRGIEGLGMGDLKFVAAAGLWTGWKGIPLLLLIASASALAFVVLRAALERKFDRHAALPFGPFLGIGTVCAWLAALGG
jgi:leader peptidase (prepilin peptidase)/N-methyltransferase